GRGRIGADAVAAREDAAVIAHHAIVAGATGDPVAAVATDDRVVLPFAGQYVVADHAVDEVVAGLAVQLVCQADVQRLAGGVVVGAARRVVEQLRRAHHDLTS